MVDILTQLWILDRELSQFLAVDYEPERFIADFRPFLLMFEYAAHGIPWLLLSFLALLVSSHFQYWSPYKDKLTLLLIGLVVDLGMIGLIKVAVRRPRPPYNLDDMKFGAPLVDRYSFPSGHTSRGAMLGVLGLVCLIFRCLVCKHCATKFCAEAYFLCFCIIYLFPSDLIGDVQHSLKYFSLHLLNTSGIGTFSLKFLPVLLAVTRVMTGRHYASDVLFGLILGLVEAYFVVYLMPSQFLQFCRSVVPFLTV